MRVFLLALISGVMLWGQAPSVEQQLAAMLERHPAADANGDGNLTEQEARDYLVEKFWKRRPNRGPAIRDPEVIAKYEKRRHGIMPYRLLKPLAIEPGKRYPLIVSLHGGGGVGDDNLSNLRVWNGLMARTEWRERHPSFVLVPQAPPGSTWGPPPEIARKQGLYMKNLLPLIFEVIAELERSYPIDAKRIYALGASMGGRGTWNILAARPDLFAAGIPVCGKTRREEAERLADMPIWCFHGDADPRVAVRYSREMFARMREIDGKMKYTELRGVKHNSWVQAFRYTGDDKAAGYITRYASERAVRTPDVWEWLFRQTKP